MMIHEYLELTDGAVRCVKCGAELCKAGENYKLGALRIDRPLVEANPLLVDHHAYVEADVVFRQYVCPGCGVLLENEVSRTDDSAIWDIKIAG